MTRSPQGKSRTIRIEELPYRRTSQFISVVSDIRYTTGNRETCIGDNGEPESLLRFTGLFCFHYLAVEPSRNRMEADPHSGAHSDAA